MAKPSYWEQRIARKTWSTYNSIEEQNIALLKRYQQAADDMSQELYTLARAAQTDTPSLSEIYRLKRLKSLRQGIRAIIDTLTNGTEEQALSGMEAGIQEVSRALATELGIEFYETDIALARRLASTPWHGADFSKRLWKNSKKLEKSLNTLLYNGLLQGDTVTQMAIAVSNTMQSAFNVAVRLVRTETMHALNAAAMERYKEAGIEQVEICAAEDERTCDICGKQHGRVYAASKCPTLPFHANCRCTIIPIIEIDND